MSATDGVARLFELAQHTVGEGPSPSAHSAQEPVTVRDLHGEVARRWPNLAGAVWTMPVGRLAALPMSVGGIRLGVLSVYGRAPSQTRLLRPAALLAAHAAALALLDVQHASADVLPLAELGRAMDYRIHQATGMVMAQTGDNAQDALTRLRASSFSSDVPLQRLAAGVISGEIGFDQEDV
jgi:hypothetical protein